MVDQLYIRDLFSCSTTLIDVRSPGEYSQGHIPGAVNIPLFTDEERAHVGTVYVRQSREKAMEIGYRYVMPKLGRFIDRSRNISPGGSITVYCMRGGLRSRSFADHLYNNGLTDVKVLHGGYRAYRRYSLDTFGHAYYIMIVGGYAGSGKTGIIRRLRFLGHQAIDLEALAVHRGSAFGDIEGCPQPTTEQFQNNLFDALRRLDRSRPIWLEDESHNIGGVTIPHEFFLQMRNSPVYFLDIAREVRARHLVAEYATSSKEFLAGAISRISRRLGREKARTCLHLLEDDKYYQVALHALSYYDKTYARGMRLHTRGSIYTLPSSTTDPDINTGIILGTLTAQGQLVEQHLPVSL